MSPEEYERLSGFGYKLFFVLIVVALSFFIAGFLV